MVKLAKVASRIIWNVIHYFLIIFLENMAMTALNEGTDNEHKIRQIFLKGRN
jgi:hypothetical protein